MKIYQQLIAQRQNAALLFISSVRWLSVFLSISGTGLLAIGVRLWSKKQYILDQKDHLEAKKLELEVQKMSLEQIKAKAIDELDEQRVINNDSDKILTPHLTLAKYIQYQHQIAEIAIKGISQTESGAKVSSYNVYQNVKVGNSEFDILIEPTSQSSTSAVIEIKYVPGKISRLWVQETIGKTLLALESYRFNRQKAVAVVFLLAPASSFQDFSAEYIK